MNAEEDCDDKKYDGKFSSRILIEMLKTLSVAYIIGSS